MKAKMAGGAADEMLSKKVDINGVAVLAAEVKDMDGGGGHKYASGASIRDKEEINKLIKSLDEECIQYKILYNR